MTLDLKTLKCGECGSHALRPAGTNQYVCEHCGAHTLVEDTVSERLDRVLDQVKDAAAERLADEQAARIKTGRGIAFILAAAVGVVVILISVNGLMVKQRQAGSGAAAVTSPLPDRAIASDGLKLAEPVQVMVGSGSSAKAKLLVMALNDTGKPLEAPYVSAEFFDGDARLGGDRKSPPLKLLLPGETAPVLFDLPGGKNVSRQDLAVQRLSAPHKSVPGPRLAFTKSRLLRQDDNLRLVGRIANTGDTTWAGVHALVLVYDEAGALAGIGRGYAQTNEIKPGERSVIEARIERLGKGKIAAWDYRLGYDLVAATGERTPVTSANRVIRTAAAPEVFNAGLSLSAEDLLADDSERFDLAQLELAPLVAGRGKTQDALYLTEVLNRSRDVIAVAPGAVISQFDGNQPAGQTLLRGPAYLYPGERFPVLLQPHYDGSGRITQTRVEWKPVRRAALPGARIPLAVHVDSTRAATSNVLVNFSQRYVYKYAEVSGTVTNPGKTLVSKVRLWVSLRDREGRLTGFSLVPELPAIAAGDSVPFQVKVDQHGHDFASVTTFYQTTD
jgi:hypothetical protein